MSDGDRDILSFLPIGKTEFAFLGTHLVGVIRLRPAGNAEWIFYLEPMLADRPGAHWRQAPEQGLARAALLRRVADWYDAAHTRLAPGQGERQAAQARV